MSTVELFVALRPLRPDLGSSRHCFEAGSALCFRALPRVTKAEATAIPVQLLGAYGLPPVGSRTTRDKTAARLPWQGSRAMGLGLTFCKENPSWHCWVCFNDYTTIQRMTISRLTKWRPDFDILMIQRLFFWKKKAKNFSYPSRVSLKDFSYPLRVPERTYTTPHGVFLPLAGADF